MKHLPRADAAPSAGWPHLIEELDRWSEAGLVAAFWWRDDDATTATAELDLLLRLAADVPLALAAIPALVRPELAEALEAAARVAVLPHGWQHQNRAEIGKKSEYPLGRSPAVVRAEIGAGFERLQATFGRRSFPVFVPPWNRIADCYLPLLPASGIAGLSRMAHSPASDLPAGLGVVDVHLDLVDWRGSREFIGVEAALGKIVTYLERSRRDAVSPGSPFGILTHHRIIDGATAKFLDCLVPLIASHRAARWAAVGEFV